MCRGVKPTGRIPDKHPPEPLPATRNDLTTGKCTFTARTLRHRHLGVLGYLVAVTRFWRLHMARTILAQAAVTRNVPELDDVTGAAFFCHVDQQIRVNAKPHPARASAANAF